MSDVKKIDISSVVDTMDNAVSSLKSSYEKTVASKNSTETDIEDLDEDKGFFEELLDDANDFKNDVLSDLADTCVTAITAVDSVLGKYEWYNDFIEFSNEKIVPFQNKVNEVLKRTGATVGTFFTSLLEGVGNLGEAFFDLTNIVRTVVFSIPTGIIDGVQAIGGAITGEEWESVTKKMWNGTKAVVSQDLTTSLFDWFYNETDPGQFLKNNSYGFDTTRSIGSGIGKVAAIVGISIASGGTLAPFAIAAMAGFGEGAEKSWAEGASIGEGLLSATLNSAWEGLQYYIGGKIGTTTLFGSSGKYLQNLNGEAFGTKLLNSLSRVMMDSADGGAEGIVQPLIAAIYKDGYYDESGNYIEFEDSDNFLDKYGEIFDDYGGVQNIFTNALVGGGASILGEAFDIGRFFNKSSSETHADIDSQIVRKIDDTHGYQLNETDITGFYKSRLESGFFTKDQIEKMIDNINNKGFLSKETGEYISNLFEDPNYDVYIKTINDMDLDSIKEKGLYCNNYATSIGGSAPKTIDDISLDATVTRIDNVIDAINTVKNANGISQGMNPINGTIILKIPKGANIEDLVYFDQAEGVYLIDPKYIDSFLGVDENGVVTGASDNLTHINQNDYEGDEITEQLYQDDEPTLKIVNNRIRPYEFEYDQNEILEILNSKQATNDLLYNLELIGNLNLGSQYLNNLSNYNDLGAIKRYEGVLAINELAKEGDITLSSEQLANMDIILQDKSYSKYIESLCADYLSKRSNIYNFDYNSQTLDGFTKEQIKSFVDILKQDPTTIRTSNFTTAQMKLASDLYTLIDMGNFPVSSNFLTNLQLLSNYYLYQISDANNKALRYANRYGVDQHSLTNLANYGGLFNPNINGFKDLNNKVIDIVKSYFPKMKKSEIARYMQGVDSTGACSYASVLNDLYMAFDGKEEAFRELFGYDMYRTVDGQKLINDQLILADFYTFANYHNKSLFEQDLFGNYRYIADNHDNQVYVSYGGTGVNIDLLNSFIRYKLANSQNDTLKQALANYNIDKKLLFATSLDSNQEVRKDVLKNLIEKEIEIGNKLDLGVYVDFVANKNYIMYEFNPKTGTYDIPFSSLSWRDSNLESGLSNAKTRAGHAMAITGIVNDGVIVASWGKEYYIPFDELKKIGITISSLDFNLK